MRVVQGLIDNQEPRLNAAAHERLAKGMQVRGGASPTTGVLTREVDQSGADQGGD